MITDALRASVSRVSRMQASACSNQATAWGMIGRLSSGMRIAHGCRLMLARIAQAAAFGLLVSAPEAANSAMFVLMFFSYASSALVPIGTMPWWLYRRRTA
jgi:hypothetical protein